MSKIHQKYKSLANSIIVGLIPFILIGGNLTYAAQNTATLSIDSDNVIEAEYIGNGVQWSPYPDLDITDSDWQRLFERADYMKLNFARVMMMSFWYISGYDQNNSPIYDFNTNKMKKLYKLLDYCKSRNVKVILGEWGDPTGAPTDWPNHLQKYGIQEDNPVWTEGIGAVLEHLIKVKGYTNIKYYNLINEPNGSWSNNANFDSWATGMKNLHKELIRRELRDEIRLVGPDIATEAWDNDWGGNHYFHKTVAQLSDVVDDYELHRYARIANIESGRYEKDMREWREYFNSKDPRGNDKKFFMGEAGLLDGKKDGDSQPLVYDFEYGVWMADYIISSMRAGMSGLIAWDFDDAMHIDLAHKDSKGPNGYNDETLGPDETTHLKIWGFWNSLAEEQGKPSDAKIRPWFYTWSLLSRAFPGGSEIISTPDSKISGLRAIVGKIKEGANYHFSIAVVNDSDEARTLEVLLPNVNNTINFDQYNYFQNDRITDSKGYPIIKKILKQVNLNDGVLITLPSRGVVILTSLDSHSLVQYEMSLK